MESISTAFAAASGKELAKPLASFISSFGIDIYNTVVSKFESCFQSHINSTFSKCSKMKNIIYRDDSVDFISHYVNVFFSSKNSLVSDNDALSRLNYGAKLLICGTAGAGKTMFMRWSALEFIRNINIYGRIPLYLEMRHYEEIKNEELEYYIYKKTSSIIDAPSFVQFKKGLEAGMFVVILDAIDEVKPSIRNNVIMNIVSFLGNYPQCGIMVSSRADDNLESLQDFSILRTTEMNRQQIVDVIENLEYDENVKAKLIGEINKGLYERLKEFLSNPLLATIMLLAFDHSANIPENITSFYQLAFEALYRRHDAAKGAYSREHHSNIPMDKFQKIFSSFCFKTYISYMFEFSDIELISEFRDALEYNQEDSDPLLIIRDAMESVCLMQKDGLSVIFTHRSFQEYFCAVFISSYRESNVKELIDAVSVKETNSNVLRMLYEISPEVFEYEWVLPKIKDFIKRFSSVNVNTLSGFQKIFKYIIPGITVDINSGLITSVSLFQGISDSLDINRIFSIEYATKGKIYPCPPIFDFKFWRDLGHLEEIGPKDIESRVGIEGDPDSVPPEEHEVIDVRLSDANWLINSNMPQFFQGIIMKSKEYEVAIEEKRKTRKDKITSILR